MDFKIDIHNWISILLLSENETNVLSRCEMRVTVCGPSCFWAPPCWHPAWLQAATAQLETALSTSCFVTLVLFSRHLLAIWGHDKPRRSPVKTKGIVKLLGQQTQRMCCVVFSQAAAVVRGKESENVFSKLSAKTTSEDEYTSEDNTDVSMFWQCYK